MPAEAKGRFYMKAPAGCEVVGLSVASGASAPDLALRPLELVRVPPPQAPRPLEVMWDGTLEIAGSPPVDVTCIVTSGGQTGHLGAEVMPRGAGASVEWTLQAAAVSFAQAFEATLSSGSSAGDAPRYEMQGRSLMTEDQHMHLLLFGSLAGDPSCWARLRLQSSSRASPISHGSLFVDGPLLVFNAASDGPSQKYTMHTASAPWTKQIAADGALLAELQVQKLGDCTSGCRGLIVGVGEPRPGGGTAPLGLWPGDRADRWLWRGDGSVSHGDPAAVWLSDVLRFDVGDTIGLCVGAKEVTLLRNGRRVCQVPRAIGLHGPLSSDSTPILIVGMACNAVLRLCARAQYPLLSLPLGNGAERHPALQGPRSTAAPARDGALLALPEAKGDIWVEITPVGTSYRWSRHLEDICKGEVVGPGQEVVAAHVEDGWLSVVVRPKQGEVVGAGRSLWLPMIKEGVGRLFARKADIRVEAQQHK